MPEGGGLAIPVELGSHSYAVQIGQGWDPASCAGILRKRPAFLVSDETVGSLYAQKWSKSAGPALAEFRIPAGETSKTMAMAEKVIGKMISTRAGRDVVVVALGGGVVGDLAGFVAATYMRGVSFIQVPTTLLAMVDSSVGGKVAVNHELGKNMIGCFYQPEAVLVSLSSLSTLSQRELSAGLAEVVKYGIIRQDSFFAWLEQNAYKLMARDPAALQHAVSVSVQTKADIVRQDERETLGLRSLLNFGHTFAHAEEVLMGYGTVLHGEAVAAGMAAACRVSRAQGHMPQSEVNRVLRLLEMFSLPTVLRSARPDFQAFWAVMEHDKKAVRGSVKFVIPEAIGRCVFPVSLERDFVERALAEN